MIEPEHIITLARGWTGTPYRHQASLKGVGCDCLGLVRGIWREAYGSEPEAPPPYAADWVTSERRETLAHAARRHMTEVPVKDMAAGDLLLFRWRDWLPARHAGIVISHTRMIHAQEGVCVSEVSLSPWWMRRVAFAFRFPKEAA